MTRTHRWLATLACLMTAAACGDDGVDVEQTFDLTFQGDATFQAPHSGQEIEVAVVDAGSVVVGEIGTVSADADPSFSFTFADVLEAGRSYEVHYWIDSNFSGGTVGVCDPPANDHQWNRAIGPVTANVTHTEDHQPSETTSVCSTF